jgi:hypothetical protein
MLAPADFVSYACLAEFLWANKLRKQGPQNAGRLNGWDMGPSLEGTVEITLFLGRVNVDCAFFALRLE